MILIVLSRIIREFFLRQTARVIPWNFMHVYEYDYDLAANTRNEWITNEKLWFYN